MSLETKIEPRSGCTGDLGGIHFFTKVPGEVVISVGWSGGTALIPTLWRFRLGICDFKGLVNPQAGVCVCVCVCPSVRVHTWSRVSVPGAPWV
jgi:hypothetical protein